MNCSPHSHDPDSNTSCLQPIVADRQLVPFLQLMLDELESHELAVILVPAPDAMHDGHMIRVAYEQNVAWYRRLCAMNPGSGKNYTAVKRQDTIKILNNLINGKPTLSKYATQLISVAQQKLITHNNNE